MVTPNSRLGTRSQMYPLNLFVYSFCVMDDYGTAIPVDPCNHQHEGCVQVMAPDYGNPPEPGAPFAYTLFTPNIH